MTDPDGKASPGPKVQQKKTVEDRVEQYLNESGFPLEMRTAAVFRRTMYSVQQRGEVQQRVTYQDSDRTKGTVIRETDVTAMAAKAIWNEVVFRLKVVVECKDSKDDPWVLFRSSSYRNSLGSESFADAWIHWSTAPNRAMASPYTFARVSGLNRDLLDTRREFCTGLESASSKPQSGTKPNYARDAVRQVLSAAASIARRDQFKLSPTNVLSVTVPVVVTTAPLFAVVGTDDGSFYPERTHRELVIGQFDADAVECPVWVVDEEGLKEIAKEFLELQAHLSYMPE